MSSREVRLSTAAKKDVREILRYTKLEWGPEQRERYGLLLTDGLERIADFPELGEPRDDLGTGVRALRVEMHIVYYRVTPKTIRILRIRHIRADTLAPNDL
jgi:toxin ParE1/3/4